MTLKKQGDLNLAISADKKYVIKANIQFSTQDSGTAELYFRFFQDGQPIAKQAGYSGQLFLLMQDGSSFLVDVEIVESAENLEARYVLTDDQVSHYGDVQAEVYLYDGNNNSISVHKFEFVIDQALVDQDITPVAEYYVSSFNELKTLIQADADELNTKIADLEDKFDDLDAIETKQGAQAKANTALMDAQVYTDDVIEGVQAGLDGHVSDTNNPHSVTKAQIGLGNVDNVQQAPLSDFNTHKSNTNNPHNVTKTQVGLGNVLDLEQASSSDFTNHINDNTNPHDVTKAQIGLSDVLNVAQASKTDFDAHADDNAIHVSPEEQGLINNAAQLDTPLTLNNKHAGIDDTNSYFITTVIEDLVFYQFKIVTSAEIPAASVLFNITPNAVIFPTMHEFTDINDYTEYRVDFQTSDVITADLIPTGTTITNSGVLFLS